LRGGLKNEATMLIIKYEEGRHDDLAYAMADSIASLMKQFAQDGDTGVEWSIATQQDDPNVVAVIGQFIEYPRNGVIILPLPDEKTAEHLLEVIAFNLNLLGIGLTRTDGSHGTIQ
jgi:hypothetical protein